MRLTSMTGEEQTRRLLTLGLFLGTGGIVLSSVLGSTFPMAVVLGFRVASLLRAGSIALSSFAFLGCVLTQPAFVRHNVGQTPPAAIGAIRILVCGILLVNTLWEDLPSIALL